jgi:hypothetical protein
MSGAKGGGVAIIPALIFGTVGAAATLAVGGVVLAVSAYRSARDRVEREREQATCAQKMELNRGLDEWQSRMASTYVPPDTPTPTVRSTAEIMAETLTSQPKSGDLKDGDLLASRREAEAPVQVLPVKSQPISRDIKDGDLSEPQREAELPVQVTEKSEMPAAKPLFDLQELVVNIKGLLLKAEIQLPEYIINQVNALYREKELDRAAVIARKIRMEITEELNKVEGEKLKEMQEARTILDGLPPDFPSEAKAVLTEAAEGRVRFDQSSKETAQEMIQAIYAQATANVLHKTFTEMGYEIEPIGNSIFTDGGEVYFRKGEWEDGYCVKLKMKNDQIKFFMQKTMETGNEYDKDMEQVWKDQFPEVQKKLLEAGLDLNVHEISPPGSDMVPKGEKIKIDTKKIKSAKGPLAEDTDKTVKETEKTAKKAVMEKSI